MTQFTDIDGVSTYGHGVGQSFAWDEGAAMDKQEKKAKQRKIKDLQTDDTTGANVKGGQAALPTRSSLYRSLNKLFRPKS